MVSAGWIVVLAATGTDAVCTGTSANLNTAECTAWQSLYDGTGGATQWTHCGANRLDPCACSYVGSLRAGPSA